MENLCMRDVVNIDLNKGLSRTYAGMVLATGDNMANCFGAALYRGGEPVDITGYSVMGYFIRKGGADTVVIVGKAEGNEAIVELPQACYASDGSFSLAIKVSGADVTATVRVVDGAIRLTQTGTMIDPGDVVPTLDELFAKIEEMEAVTAEAQVAADTANQAAASVEGFKTEIRDDLASLTEEIEKIGNALPLVFVEGKYLTGAEIGTSDGFGYSEPVYIAKGAVLAIKARGYRTNVNIVSKVTEDLSSITRIVRSVDSEYRWYEYTVAESGYYSFSGNITVKLIVFAKENELLGANVDMDGVAHETLAERLDYDFTAAFNASGISYIQPIFTEGFYITGYSTLEENSDFLYSEPFVVKAGMKIRVKARGYLANVGIIAETDANLSTIKTVVRSVDSTYQWYEYTAPHDGYYFVSGNKDSIIIIKIVETGKVPNDLVFCDLSLWRKFGVVGDSYASGELYFGDTYADKYDISWGQILARKTGATCTNYSAGGLSTRSWLTYSKGLPLLLSSDPEDIYFLVLGINDYYHLGEDYLGSIADITSYTSYSDYADTFYGNYGKIIEQIKAHAPYSKIVMFTCANTNAVPALFNSAIVEIANHYEIPYIVQAEDEFFQSEIYTDMSGGHPTAIGYSGMASAFERLLIKCMRENHSYFRDSFMY